MNLKKFVPFLQTKSSQSLPPGYTLFFSGGNVFGIPSYSLTQIITHYYAIAPLSTGITKIAKAVGTLPLVLEEMKTKEVIESHPLLELLSRPNKDMQKTQRALFESMITWFLLSGTTYVIATGGTNKAPLELYVADTKYIRGESGNNGFVDKYIYNPPQMLSEVYNRDGTGRFIRSDGQAELLQICTGTFGYSGRYFEGSSPILALYFEIMQYLNASQHNLGLLTNGARPSGALIMKGKDGTPITLTEEAFARLKAQIDAEYTGAQNTGRPLLLEGGMEWQEMSMTPKDMDFTKAKTGAEMQIYNRLGIPLPLVTNDAKTFNNYKEAKSEFYEETVVPTAEDMLDYIGDFLIPRYPELKGKYRLTVDRDAVSALYDKQLARSKGIQENNSLMLNEKRELQGYETIEGGNAVFNDQGTAYAGKDKPDVVAPPLNPSKPAFDAGKKMLVMESKELFQVEQAVDEATIYAATLDMSRQMYKELVEAFGKDAVEEIAALSEFEINNRVTEFINSSSATLITQVNDTTKNKIRKELLEAVQNNEGLSLVAARIAKVFESGTQARIDTIAITETTAAAGFAMREAATQGGFDKMTWLAVRDGHTRDAHLYLDGKTSDAEGYFYVDGARATHPGGFGVAELDINCRCAVRIATDEEAKAHSYASDSALWRERETRRGNREAIVKATMARIFNLQYNAVLARLIKNS